jgi:hypothetical protein
VVEEGDPLDVRFLLNEKVLDSFDNWCIRYQKTAGTLRNHFKYFSQFWQWFSVSGTVPFFLRTTFNFLFRGQPCAQEWVPRLQSLDNTFKDTRSS